MKEIFVKGASQHNLKHIDVRIPRDAFVVISGPSGSGKSSLAFDTIFAEGQRRFVESLSSYVRQFLGRLEKPKVDYIEGLSPAISIEQKTTNRNPRSTVGTITEISDYYRLLFARVGIPHDPASGKRIEKQTVDQIVAAVLSYPEGSRAMIFAPVVRNKKGQHKKILEDAEKSGFTRVRINGELHELGEEIELDRQRRHSIDVLIDRVKIAAKNRKRIVEALETALEISDGLVRVRSMTEAGESEQAFSLHFAYPDSELSFPQLEPALFSFNSPVGACQECAGLGVTREFDMDLIVPDRRKSFEEGAFLAYSPSSDWNYAKFSALAKTYGFSLDAPVQDYPEDAYNKLVQGDEKRFRVVYTMKDRNAVYEREDSFPGIFADLHQRYRQTTSQGIREWLESFMHEQPCSACGGKRLRPEALAVFVDDRNIQELSLMTIVDALEFFRNLELTKTEQEIAGEILKEIVSRLSFLVDVGLDYLSLHRNAGTLSGGEAQRIRLASQLGSSLVGVLYVLDEPTIGLHQRDNERLLATLKRLRDLGNTLIVVEHDEQTLREADFILDLGPAAGVHGGEIVASGSPADILADARSLTGQYLSGSKKVREQKEARREPKGWLELRGVQKHNIANIDLKVPLGVLTVITGVSGSGKSTLICDVLLSVLQGKGNKKEYHELEGGSQIDKVLEINQSPIGRTPRSNPATYVGMFQHIRELFSMLPDSRARGYKPGRFSFNVKGGRCEHCEGAGVIKIDMQFLPDIYVRCDVCKGKRYTFETLDIKLKEFNIYDVLNLTVDEACEVFSSFPKVMRKLETLSAVGLGYIKLGQSALTLSGGEAQRVKLSLELSKRSTGRTICIMDEPTTGLHFDDTRKLLEVIDSLVEKGNSVIIIEHNLDVICHADYIVDLGPEGGDRGGKIVAEGNPEYIAAHPSSITGRFVKDALLR